MTNFYFLVMSQKEMLKNQVIEEILRERANFYLTKSRPLDFWLTLSPNFIYTDEIFDKICLTHFFKNNFEELIDEYDQPKQDYLSAIVSTDKEFIKWLELRIGFFENLDYSPTIQDKETFFEINNQSFTSDGVKGVLVISEIQHNRQLFPLSELKIFVDPNILIKKYEKILNLYYSNFKNKGY